MFSCVQNLTTLLHQGGEIKLSTKRCMQILYVMRHYIKQNPLQRIISLVAKDLENQYQLKKMTKSQISR